MSGSGKGGNSRKNRHRFSKRKNEPPRQNEQRQGVAAPNQKFEASGTQAKNNPVTEVKSEKKHLAPQQERLRWTAPLLPKNPITTPECPWCGKQIKDITTAITDKNSGLPVHFDCVLARISSMEKLEKNDSVCYIGGGRFGVINQSNPSNPKSFTVKKIYE